MSTPDQPLRIAHINSEKGFSGGEAQMFLLMRGLRERGHHNVLCCRPGSRSARAAAQEGFEVHTASMGSDLDLAGVLGLRRALRRCSADIVNLHTGRATWLGGLAAWLAKVPAVTTRRMDRAVKRGPRTRLIYNRLVRRVAAVSPAVIELLRQAGVAREKIELICDAVEPDALRAERGRREVREAEGLGEGRALLLVLASLDHRKGIDVLLESLSLLRERGMAPLPMLWVAGSGPEEQALRGQIERLGLLEDVRLLGRREDAPDLLNACDIFVLPSRREGLGVAALEAMAVGKPVVASRVGGLAQAVADRETGLLVAPESPTALAQALEEFLGDARLLNDLARRGPAHIAQSYLGKDQVLRYERLYGAALGQGG